MIERERAARGFWDIRCTGTSFAWYRARPGRLDDYYAGELIGADVVVVDEILQSPTKLFWAGVDLFLAQDDDGDDLVGPHALLDAALMSVSGAADEI